MTADRVSVIIPVRNGRAYVLEAIESCLQQTHHPLEIIVVDDGSTDDTSGAIRAAALRSVRIIEQDWQGAGRALNAGVAAIDPSADSICFLDHDDIWLPQKLRLQLDAFAAAPSLDAVFGHVMQFVSPEIAPAEAARLEVPDAPQPGMSISAMMIRRAALARLGPFPEQRDAFAFPPWYIRARAEGFSTQMLEPVLVKRRLHRTNASRIGRAYYQDAFLDLARAAIMQRRPRGP